MASTGKKINELTQISTVTDETVLPGVYVNSSIADSTASKISVQQLSAKVQNDMSGTLANKQDKLTAGTNISIENNVISSTSDSLPSQTGNSGKFLTTDGTSASWASVSDPANVWTQDNLKAGNNISIAEVQQPVIDENTMGVWHFDSNSEGDATGNNYYTLTPTVYDLGKFSKSSRLGEIPDRGGSGTNWKTNTDVIGTGDFTTDFWVYINTADTYSGFANMIPSFTFGYNNYIGFQLRVESTTECRMVVNGTYVSDHVTRFTWHHIAFERYTGYIRVYLDGKLVFTSSSTNSDSYMALFTKDAGYGSEEVTYFDELRISNIARYKGQDFTPFNQPYTTASGETQYAINADLSSKQDVLTNATGYDATKTQVLKNVNGTLTWVDEA